MIDVVITLVTLLSMSAAAAAIRRAVKLSLEITARGDDPPISHRKG